MVPDLVVFEVLEGDRVEPVDFGADIAVGCEDCFCAVEPMFLSALYIYG
jgi:hypothetical protein